MFNMFFLFALVALLADFILYRRLKRSFSLKKHTTFHTVVYGLLLTFAILTVAILALIYLRPLWLGNMQWVLFCFLLVSIPPIFFLIWYMVAVLPFSFIKKQWGRKITEKSAIIGYIFILLIFGAILYGGVIGKNILKVTHTHISSKRLPEGFELLKVIQISDLHLASFDKDTTFIKKMVDRINALEPDIVAFTGDIVTIKSDEMPPFVHVLSEIKAKYGVYSILGNHDYGDYYNWSSPAEKEVNFQALIDMQKQMGWKLLNDTTVFIKKGADSIAIIGVQNVGDAVFKEYGSLRKAIENTAVGEEGPFAILLSHNPKHWRNEVLHVPGIDLTLAGHTHAMQIKIGNFSPSKWIYNNWNGLYQEGSQYLYVNRGVGCALIPMRIGAAPEITEILITH